MTLFQCSFFPLLNNTMHCIQARVYKKRRVSNYWYLYTKTVHKVTWDPVVNCRWATRNWWRLCMITQRTEFVNSEYRVQVKRINPRDYYLYLDDFCEEMSPISVQWAAPWALNVERERLARIECHCSITTPLKTSRLTFTRRLLVSLQYFIMCDTLLFLCTLDTGKDKKIAWCS